MSTHVCITVDTEFSIGGAFGAAGLSPVGDPLVWCMVGERSEGLGFLLDCFRQYGIVTTFFIEALHRAYFQDDPMRSIANHAFDAGHEVQLHAHPCWSVFKHANWRERVRQQPQQDNFFGRCEDESLALILDGLDAFDSWGLPRPKVFRSGRLQHDDTLYRAISRAGIPYSSNVGLAIFDSGDPRYQLYSGCHDRHGVIECPVLTFNDWSVGARRHLKSLTITGTSFEETRTVLERAESAGIPLVVILTHPFEYIQGRESADGRFRRHAVNQQRLAKLCRFLAENPQRFPASGLAATVEQIGIGALTGNSLLKGRIWQSAGRMASQVCYEHFGRLALLRRPGIKRQGGEHASAMDVSQGANQISAKR